MNSQRPENSNTAVVSPQEAGMKLMRFLEGRLENNQPERTRSTELHKWIRTGQVRVNKKRAKPFALLNAGDVVRLPPFAAFIVRGAGSAKAPECATLSVSGKTLGRPDLSLVAETDDYLVLCKASGLAVQDGSGLADSVAARLKAGFSHLPYIPAPAHRLDRFTSGLVLAGKSHAAQQHLHSLFASHDLVKEYLLWGAGTPARTKAVPCPIPFSPGDLPFGLAAPAGPPFLAEDSLVTGTRPDGREYITLADGDNATNARTAAAIFLPLAFTFLRLPAFSGPATLLLVRLLTGRKHQIRVQIASRGCPVIGDVKYGGPRFFPMLLHAWRLTLPCGTSYTSLPENWPPM